MKSQLSAAARKAGGSLAVREVSSVVKPEQVGAGRATLGLYWLLHLTPGAQGGGQSLGCLSELVAGLEI